MMRDFSFTKYTELINALKSRHYQICTFSDYLNSAPERAVILRHDVDILAYSALQLALLENELGVKGTYFFRTTKYSYKPELIKRMASLGHEIGYHYEDLSRNNGDYLLAEKEFAKNLQNFRALYPVKTVCMHGSSGSPYDNRDLWKTIKLADYGLVGEPYLSIDFNAVLYLTDTTQRWNGGGIAVRDNVGYGLKASFSNTDQILESIDELPAKLMITIHPELWAKHLPHWLLARLFVFTHGNYKKYFRNRRMKKRQIATKKKDIRN